MGFTLNPKYSICRGLKRVIRKALRHGCEHLQHAHETGVHEARKSVKKVRAVVTLLQQVDADGLDKDARRLRAAGHTLSILRDADAIIATFDMLRKRFSKRLPEHTYAKAVLANQPAPYTDAELGAVATHCTSIGDAARKVEREMSKRIAAVAMSSHIGEGFDAIVTGVTPHGTFVRVVQPHVEGLLAQGPQGPTSATGYA
jgi:hypothetical protein